MIYRITYTNGVRHYVDAESNNAARSRGREAFPDYPVSSAKIAKEMEGLPLTDWNVLAVAENRVACSTCGTWIAPVKLFSPVKDVAKRPCHDAVGHAFCNVACREGYAEATERVTAYDYDTWATVVVDVPISPEARDQWNREWTLVPFLDQLVLIATERYERMQDRAKETRRNPIVVTK